MEIIEKIITDRQSRDMEHSQEPRTEKGRSLTQRGEETDEPKTKTWRKYASSD